MKKLCTVLFGIGFFLALSSIVLKLLHIYIYNLFAVAELFFLSGIILLPSLVWHKYRKYMLRQKIFLVVLWLGLILVSTGHVFRYENWDSSRNILLAGYSLLLVYVFYVVIMLIATKLRTDPFGKQMSPEALLSFGVTAADLEKFTGTYNNEKIPLKIAVSQFGDTLIAQATSQPAFYLEMIGKNEFKYPKRDIVIEFDLAKNELILKQHGGFFLFIREV